MKRLVFIVEGRSEEQFITHFLIPYLANERGLGVFPMNAQQLTTNRKKSIRGGSISFGKLANDVRNAAHSGNTLVTTMIDFFKLPTDFPEYSKEKKDIVVIESAVRKNLSNEVSPAVFLPYIQLHEFEALLFSSMDGFKAIVDDKTVLSKLEAIENRYSNPEDINGGEQTAPSKRMMRLFNYEKVTDSYDALSKIPIDVIRSKCPRFDRWLQLLEKGLTDGYFESE